MVEELPWVGERAVAHTDSRADMVLVVLTAEEAREAEGELAVATMLAGLEQAAGQVAAQVMIRRVFCLMLEQEVTTNKRQHIRTSAKARETSKWSQCQQTSGQIGAFASYHWPWAYC